MKTPSDWDLVTLGIFAHFKLGHVLLSDIFVHYFGMKILSTFLTDEKKNMFWTNKFVYLIFINKLSYCHPKIMYKKIVQKDMNKFFVSLLWPDGTRSISLYCCYTLHLCSKYSTCQTIGRKTGIPAVLRLNTVYPIWLVVALKFCPKSNLNSSKPNDFLTFYCGS